MKDLVVRILGLVTRCGREGRSLSLSLSARAKRNQPRFRDVVTDRANHEREQQAKCMVYLKRVLLCVKRGDAIKERFILGAKD
jgi:hypothetical protein